MIAMTEEARKPFVTIAEAAAIAHVPEHTVRYWLTKKYLTRHKVRKIVFIRREQLEAFLGQAPEPVEE